MRKLTLFFVLSFLLISVRSGAQITKRWYSYAQYLNYNTASIDSVNMAIWKDTSALIINSGSTYDRDYFTSVGMSFAPVLSAWNDPSYFGSTIQVSASNAYTIDSVRIKGAYLRNNAKTAPVDTIFLSFVYGNGTSATNLIDTYYTGSGMLSAYGHDTVFFPIMSYDTVKNIAAKYPATSVTPYVQYITLANTDTAVNFERTIYLTTPFAVPAGNIAAVSLSFKSGDASFVPLDTVQYASGAVKYGDFFPRIVFYAMGGTPEFPPYSPIDRNTGYFAERSLSSISDGYKTFYIPNWAWTSGLGGGSYLQYPDIDFHISCTTCSTNLAISGTTSVCAGGTTTLSSASTGGTWSSSNTAFATVGSSSGVVSGVAPGTANITYTLSGSYVTAVVTVNAATSAGTIGGVASVCIAAATTLTDATSGGAWSSGSTAIATVSTAGVVTGGSAGTAIISYAVTGTCGTAYATTVVTVDSSPSVGTISGPAVVCTTSTIPLTDAATGGIWSSGSTGIATVGSSTGVVSGVSAGTATISYTVANACGSVYSTYLVSVNTLVSVAGINGVLTICSTTSTLSDVTGGGVWSSNNTSIATVGSSTGIVTGISSGTAVISYTISSGCGTPYATAVVTVNTAPNAGSISGIATVCVLSTTSLSDVSGGGVWSSSNTGIATVGTSGLVSGVAAGTAAISYTVTNSCGTAHTTSVVTVNPLPDAGSISGTATVCGAATTSLSDAAGGGTWSSGNTGIATVGTSGLVTGVVPGTAVISYTVTNSCGTVYATSVVTVNPLPDAGSISGLSQVCAGSTITLSDVAGGGTWSSSSGIALVGTGGIVSGISTGTVIISYTVSNSCGTAHATEIVTVSTTPSAGTITGPSSVCPASVIDLSDAVTGGVWASSNTGIATVGSTGAVTGGSSGTVIISYTVTNACGSVTATVSISVSTLTSAGTIVGPSTVCVGSYDTLTNTVTGGSWTARNGHVFISSGGIVLGVSAGVDTISYTITFTCSTTTTASATTAITVNPMPDAGTISGLDTVCKNDTIALTDAATGGAWTAANSNAFVSSGGVVFGAAVGTDNITYTVTNVCGIAAATDLIYVKNCAAGVANVWLPEGEITLYPNPAHNSITITSGEPMHDIVISNPLGQVVFSGSYSTTEAVIDLGQLPGGIYIARINGNVVKKFVKE